jgi:hypothetical protein
LNLKIAVFATNLIKRLICFSEGDFIEECHSLRADGYLAGPDSDNKPTFANFFSNYSGKSLISLASAAI